MVTVFSFTIRKSTSCFSELIKLLLSFCLYITDTDRIKTSIVTLSCIYILIQSRHLIESIDRYMTYKQKFLLKTRRDSENTAGRCIHCKSTCRQARARARARAGPGSRVTGPILRPTSIPAAQQVMK